MPQPPLNEEHAEPRPDAPPPNRSTRAAVGSTVAVVVVLATLAIGTYALFRMGDPGASSTAVPERFQLDLTTQMEVPAELLKYAQQRRIDVSLKHPTAFAVGPTGHLYVAGDSSIEIIAPDGTSIVTAIGGHPTCLTAAAQGDAGKCLVYVGIDGHVAVLGETGEVMRQWPAADARSILTSIVVADHDVFVADAGQKVVRHYNTDGKLLGTIGKPDPDRQMPGFVIPSPYFDLVVDQDDLLHIVNPGMRRVEAYSFDGELQSFWGRGGSALADFFGCCNPAHLAIMSDGRFVTVEKGIPRVKVYSREGELQQVVAGPRQLGISAAALGDARGNQKERVFDVAVDGSGNVLVLDPRKCQIIVFVEFSN